jgi:hypothetical protein
MSFCMKSPTLSTEQCGPSARGRYEIATGVGHDWHVMLARPRDRCVEQAGDGDPLWQWTFDGGFDQARCEELLQTPVRPSTVAAPTSSRRTSAVHAQLR